MAVAVAAAACGGSDDDAAKAPAAAAAAAAGAGTTEPGSATAPEGEDGTTGTSPSPAPPAAGSGSPAGTVPEPEGTLCPFVFATGDEVGFAAVAGAPADEAVAAVPVLTFLASMLEASGLDERLGAEDGVTILAPFDDGVRLDVSEDEFDELVLVRHDDLARLLEGHVIAGRHSVADLVEAGRATTLAGTRITVAEKGGTVSFGGDAKVLCADVEAANATIHIVDSMIGRDPAPEEIETG